MRVLAWQPAVTLGVLDLLRRGWLANPNLQQDFFIHYSQRGRFARPPLFFDDDEVRVGVHAQTHALESK